MHLVQYGTLGSGKVSQSPDYVLVFGKVVGQTLDSHNYAGLKGGFIDILFSVSWKPDH